MKRRKSSFAFFSKDKTPVAQTEGDTSPDTVFVDKNDLSDTVNVSCLLSS